MKICEAYTYLYCIGLDRVAVLFPPPALHSFWKLVFANAYCSSYVSWRFEDWRPTERLQRGGDRNDGRSHCGMEEQLSQCGFHQPAPPCCLSVRDLFSFYKYKYKYNVAMLLPFKDRRDCKVVGERSITICLIQHFQRSGWHKSWGEVALLRSEGFAQ